MPTFVHFDIPADEPDRAKKFYESLFDWKITAVPGPVPYHFIETAHLDGRPGELRGGMGKRGAPDQRITNYVGVESVDDCAKRVEELGGKITSPKMPVPGFGFLMICMDTEGNTFGLWQEDTSAV